MKRMLLFVLFMGLIHLSPYVMAQQKTVSGRVVSEADGIPLSGVSVVVKETGNGVTTDDRGEYFIRVSVGQTLVFTYIGANRQEVTVGGDDAINVSLETSGSALEEVVVVGYGVQTRANMTGAVSTVDVDKTFKTRPVTDAGRALQGAVSGLTITTASGALGENPIFRLRGVTGSLQTQGGAAPLILVDGVEIPNLSMVNPHDIETVSVIKDATAAIYGSRAAWGVILITTKSGKRNAASQITYSNNMAWLKPTTVPEIAPAAEGATAALLAFQRANPSLLGFSSLGIRYDEYAIEKMAEWEALYGGSNLGREMVEGRDWEIKDGFLYFHRSFDPGKEFMKNASSQQNHYLDINGGSENINYNIGLAYMNEDGMLKFNTDQHRRYNLNASVNATVNSWLDAYAKVLYTYRDFNRPYSYNGNTYDPWFYLFRWPKNFPYGTIDGHGMRNAITDVEQAKMSDTRQNMGRLTIGGRAKILPGLTVDGDYTFTNQTVRFNETGGIATGWDFWAGGGMILRPYTAATHDRVLFEHAFQDRHVGNLYANYVKGYKDHNFKLTAGVNAELFQNSYTTSARTQLMDPDYGQLRLATGVPTVNDGAGHWSTLGFFGRFNYDYNNKYLLEVVSRYDGSSRFPSDIRWGFFPAVSAGYVLSEESFMDFAKPYLSFLKVRGSWGSVGNQTVNPALWLSTMNTITSNWLIGTEMQNTLTTPTVVSPTLSWETVTTREIGVDAAFFQNRLNITFNRYSRTVSDMITAGIVLPTSFGAASPVRNFGEMQTKGWELEVGFNHTFDNGFGMSFSGQLNDYLERITKFEGLAQVLTTGGSSNYAGKVIGEIWGYETDRLFTHDDFQQDASGNLLTDANGRYILRDGVPSQSFYESGSFFYGPGDVKFRDLNGDGVINVGDGTVENPGDRRIIGYSNPRYQYGFRADFTFRGFDLGFFLQGVGRRDMWANGDMFIPGFRPGEAWYSHQMDFWTADNLGAFYPRPTNQNQSNSTMNFMPQTRYLLDMSYLRLKNLTFGYTFPQQWLQRAKVNSLRLFFSGENLLEFHNLNMPIDPETDYTVLGINDGNTFGRVYPYRRTFSFGLQLSL